jgi:hypothetical protein
MTAERAAEIDLQWIKDSGHIQAALFDTMATLVLLAEEEGDLCG